MNYFRNFGSLRQFRDLSYLRYLRFFSQSSTFTIVRQVPRYYEQDLELQDYVGWVDRMTKEDLGNPFDPRDRPDNFLPPALRELYRHDPHDYYMKRIIKMTQWYRMRPDERTEKIVSVGSMEWDSNYLVEYALVNTGSQYPNTVAVQHAMIDLLNKLEKLTDDE